MMKLEESRKLIDEIDSEIVALLKRRADLACRIGSIKLNAGLPIADREREKTVIRRALRENGGQLSDRAVTVIYREILSESRRIQNAVANVAPASEEVCQ